MNTQGIEGGEPGAFYASHIEELVRLLQAQTRDIPFESENSLCLSSVVPGSSDRSEEALQEAEEAKRQAEEANRKLEEAQKKADEAKQRADLAAEETEKIHQELEEAKQRAEEANWKLEEAQKELERRRKEVDQQMLIWGILLGSLTLAALLFGLRKPRQQIIRVAEQMSRPIRRRERDGVVQQPVKEPSANQRPTRGLVLTGFDGNGNRVHIALSPEKFAGQRLGVSLGRHPGLVDEIIPDEQVSRRHLRITVRDDQFYIEDLNSSNGTFLNRHRLSPFRPEPLDYGATVALGGLEVMVSKY